jgi:hypothetical protein
MSTLVILPFTPSAPALTAATLEANGYLAGWPPWLTQESIDMNLRLVARCRCGHCRGKGLVAEPFHRFAPVRSFKVLATCQACGRAEEM